MIFNWIRNNKERIAGYSADPDMVHAIHNEAATAGMPAPLDASPPAPSASSANDRNRTGIRPITTIKKCNLNPGKRWCRAEYPDVEFPVCLERCFLENSEQFKRVRANLLQRQLCVFDPLRRASISAKNSG